MPNGKIEISALTLKERAVSLDIAIQQAFLEKKDVSVLFEKEAAICCSYDIKRNIVTAFDAKNNMHYIYIEGKVEEKPIGKEVIKEGSIDVG